MRFWMLIMIGSLAAIGCKGEKDADGDGALAGFDCDDEDPNRSPYLDETCDGIDNDCDQLVDEDDPGVLGAVLLFEDLDGDGFGTEERLVCDPEGMSEVTGDCDDDAVDVHPGADEVCEDGIDQDCDGEDSSCSSATLPVAPSASQFMVQGAQTAFVDADGAACDVHIALAVGDQTVCYASNQGSLHCAGRIYTEVYGSSFTDTGLTGVEQVLFGPTSTVENGNTAVVLANGVPTGLGYENEAGQLGTGDDLSVGVWTPWVAGPDEVVMLATGTFGHVCALDADGGLWCTGRDYGLTPTLQAGGPYGTLWVDAFGTNHPDDPAVWRASAARADCTIRSTGLHCGTSTGSPGHVVDGGQAGVAGFLERRVWLEDDGTVHEFRDDGLGAELSFLFDGLTVLAIGYSHYTDTVCAVPNDGSLWCIGSNAQGKVGNGTPTDLEVETEVAPPGTFDLACR